MVWAFWQSGGHTWWFPSPAPSFSTPVLPASSGLSPQLQLLHYAIKVQNVQHARPLKAFASLSFLSFLIPVAPFLG